MFSSLVLIKVWRRQVWHLVLGTIFHYAERCVTWHVIMVQPRIVGNDCADTNNAQFCENLHLKNCINCLSEWYELFRDDSMSIEKQMTMEFYLDLLIRVLRGVGKKGCVILRFTACSLGRTHKSGFLWWERQIAVHLTVYYFDSTQGTNFMHIFLMVKFSVTISKTLFWGMLKSSAIILILILRSPFS